MRPKRLRQKKAVNPTDPDIRLKTFATLNSRLEGLIGPVSRAMKKRRMQGQEVDRHR